MTHEEMVVLLERCGCDDYHIDPTKRQVTLRQLSDFEKVAKCLGIVMWEPVKLMVQAQGWRLTWPAA
jgi:uncharacterized protein (DUF934 family)